MQDSFPVFISLMCLIFEIPGRKVKCPILFSKDTKKVQLNNFRWKCNWGYCCDLFRFQQWEANANTVVSNSGEMFNAKTHFHLKSFSGLKTCRGFRLQQKENNQQGWITADSIFIHSSPLFTGNKLFPRRRRIYWIRDDEKTSLCPLLWLPCMQVSVQIHASTKVDSRAPHLPFTKADVAQPLIKMRSDVSFWQCLKWRSGF